MQFFEDIFAVPIKIIIGMITVLSEHYGRMVQAGFIVLGVIIFGLLAACVFYRIKNGKMVDLKNFSLSSWIGNNATFLIGNIVLAVFMGLVIPLTVLSSSPVEFASAGVKPGILSVHAFLPYLGFFMIYMVAVYVLLPDKARKVMAYAGWIFTGVAVLDYLGFGWNLGIMSYEFEYDTGVEYSSNTKIIGLLLALLVAAVMFIIMKFKPVVSKYVYMILLIACVWMSASDIFIMNNKLSAAAESSSSKEKKETIELSKNGQNVIVLMLDRAINHYVPYMFAEHPELNEEFSGFTYYNNTITFGKSTNLGTPALFGGYEYTPLEINKRDSEKLVDKQNEALRVMPVIFEENNYKVTVADPPCANYQFTFDVSIYDEYPDINAFNIIGQHMDESEKVFGSFTEERQKHNIVCYSLMRVMPAKLQKLLYDSGDYLSTQKKVSVNNSFMQSYTGLTCLMDITEVNETDDDTFFMFQNMTTHEQALLQRPDYTPSVDEPTGVWDDMDRFTLDGVTIKMENKDQMEHYHINMAAFLRLGEWFDYLKAQGVWDNTRIIIVSDHAFDLGQFEDMKFDNGFDCECFNSLLMVKDFNASGDLKKDETFMTIADVPTLAMDGVIDNPINPFTGKVINSDAKSEEDQIVTTSANWRFEGVEDNTFDLSDGEFWSVHDNIFDGNNWKKVDPDQ